MESINFELSKPISYANGSGQPIECSFIELRAPTGKVSHIACDIESLIQSSILKMAEVLGDDVIAEAKETAEQAKSAEPDDDEEKEGDSMLSLMVSSGVDMKKVVLHFRDLFKEVAWMGGEKKITSARMDEISHKDLRKMIGVYAANFILS